MPKNNWISSLISDLTCACALVALASPFLSTPALAADEFRWKPVPLPSEGRAGGWVLAWSSEARHLTAAADGALYCYAAVSDTTETLFRSVDGGATWSPVGGVRDAIVDIAVLPSNPSAVYYATSSRVYRSADSGATFVSLPPNPGGAGSGNVTITSIDAVQVGSVSTVVASTADADAGQFGGIYTLDENSPGGTWTSAGAGNYDYLRVVFSRDYLNDRVLVAVGTNETDTVVRHRFADYGWAQTYGDGRIAGVVPVAASAAFPADYATTGLMVVGIDTGAGRGDVYRVNRAGAPSLSTCVSLHAGSADGLITVDIAGVALTGPTLSGIVAGCARTAGMYFSYDGGQTWSAAQKPPTGQTQTCVVADPRNLTPARLYAVTCGAESAFSVCEDGGNSWQQVSLIDTRIRSLLSFTAAPVQGVDPAIFLTTRNTGGKDSLWRSFDNGLRWQRVFSSALPRVDSLGILRADPRGSMLFLGGRSGGGPILWTSSDMGQQFSGKPVPCSVDALATADKDNLVIGGNDGARVLVCRSNNGGAFYSQVAEVGGGGVTSLALSPDYTRDGTVYAGVSTGQILRSNASGSVFTQVGQTLPVAGAGIISLAVDGGGTLYAASNLATTGASKERLFRLDSGQSPIWLGMYASFPVGAVLNSIAVNADGVLYVIDGQSVVAADSKGAPLRVFGPGSASPSFTPVLGGVADSAQLTGIRACGNRLWCIDVPDVALLTLTDAIGAAPILSSPPDRAAGLGTEVKIEWRDVAGATRYEWQVGDSTGILAVSPSYTGATALTSVRVSGLLPGVTYYWRVRVTLPCYGPWSTTRSFSVLPPAATASPVLTYPAPGAVTPVKPVLQWQKINGAERYELLVAADSSFTNVVVARTGDAAITSNVWEFGRPLENGATYFWKVRVCAGSLAGDWSAVGSFTTEPAPPASASATLPTTPPTAPAGTSSPPPGDLQVTLPTFTASPQQITIFSPPQTSQTAVTNLPPITNIQLVAPTWALVTGISLLACMVGLLMMLVVLLLKRKP